MRIRPYLHSMLDWAIQGINITSIPNANNAAEGENNIKYASSYPMDFKGRVHDTDEWRDYDEDHVPFERLETVYVPDEDSLE